MSVGVNTEDFTMKTIMLSEAVSLSDVMTERKPEIIEEQNSPSIDIDEIKRSKTEKPMTESVIEEQKLPSINEFKRSITEKPTPVKSPRSIVQAIKLSAVDLIESEKELKELEED